MNIYNIPLNYTWKIKIPSFDVDQNRRLRLSSQLRLQQVAGELQFEEAGLGFDELISLGFAFVITRTNSRIYRAPLLDEQVNLTTWHRNSKGAQFFRCYQFTDIEGNVIIESVSSFALVDPETHKILRPSLFAKHCGTEQPKRNVKCRDPERLKLPNNLKTVDERIIRWSDIDCNCHLNNAVYADIICDIIPKEMRNHTIKGFTISFIHEALEGESITLQNKIVTKDNYAEIWTAGNHTRGRCFESCIYTEP